MCVSVTSLCEVSLPCLRSPIRTGPLDLALPLPFRNLGKSCLREDEFLFSYLFPACKPYRGPDLPGSPVLLQSNLYHFSGLRWMMSGTRDCRIRGEAQSSTHVLRFSGTRDCRIGGETQSSTHVLSFFTFPLLPAVPQGSKYSCWAYFASVET